MNITLEFQQIGKNDPKNSFHIKMQIPEKFALSCENHSSCDTQTKLSISFDSLRKKVHLSVTEPRLIHNANRKLDKDFQPLRQRTLSPQEEYYYILGVEKGLNQAYKRL